MEYLSNLNNYQLEDNIVCYVTKSHMECNPPGIGILVKIPKHPKHSHDKAYASGFMYHKNLLSIHRDNSQVTFEAESARQSVRKAICGGRQVFIFESFEKFLKFSAEHYGY